MGARPSGFASDPNDLEVSRSHVGASLCRNREVQDHAAVGRRDKALERSPRRHCSRIRRLP